MTCTHIRRLLAHRNVFSLGLALGFALIPPTAQGLKDSIQPQNRSQALCQELVASMVPALRSLFLGASHIKADQIKHSDFGDFLNWESQSCLVPIERKRVLQQAINIVSKHSGRVGVILRRPPDPADQSNDAVAEGIMHGLKIVDPKFSHNVTIKYAGDDIEFRKALAELILVENVSALVGGLNREDAILLNQYSHRLKIPVLILHYDQNISKGNPHAFHIFPNPKNLVSRLLELTQASGWKKIAIARAQDMGSDLLAKEFKKQSKALEIELVGEVTFDIDNYQSIHGAAQELFEVRPGDRAQEFNQVKRDARRKAIEDGVQYSPKMVFLPPKVNFDALFIPSDVRGVRYFVKAMKYLGVESLQLLGTHNWRSEALVKPSEPFLEGSVFVDFVGPYSNLPETLRQGINQNQWFVRQDRADQLDFNMIGFYAGITSGHLISLKPYKRNHLYRALLQAKHGRAREYFDNLAMFDQQRMSQWPTSLMKIEQGKLQLTTPEQAHPPLVLDSLSPLIP